MGPELRESACAAMGRELRETGKQGQPKAWEEVKDCSMRDRKLKSLQTSAKER